MNKCEEVAQNTPLEKNNHPIFEQCSVEAAARGWFNGSSAQSLALGVARVGAGIASEPPGVPVHRPVNQLARRLHLRSGALCQELSNYRIVESLLVRKYLYNGAHTCTRVYVERRQ